MTAEIRADLSSRYVRRLDASVLSAPTMAAMLARLHDPYTVYLTPHEYSLIRTSTQGSFVGLGLQLAHGTHGIKVRASLEGSPAARAGINGGDTILAINGVSTRTLSLSDALRRLHGRGGTRVFLSVLRVGDHNPTVIRLVRTRVELPMVHWRDVHGASGAVRVITVSEFSLGVGAKVRAAVHGAHRVVLDLRGDDGGLLDEAVATADVFLGKGTIVSWRGAHTALHVVEATHDPAGSMPVVVLVDRRTASAAELVTAALQDNHRAVVVGTRTFGKASVQAIEPLADGGALKLTIANYRTPDGRDLHGRGVRPDVPAALHALRRALHTFAAA